MFSFVAVISARPLSPRNSEKHFQKQFIAFLVITMATVSAWHQQGENFLTCNYMANMSN